MLPYKAPIIRHPLGLRGALMAGDYAAFYLSMVAQPYGCVRLDDGSFRFEVRPGDCSRNDDWDDCATDRERAELTESKYSECRAGSDRWHGFSLMVPGDFPHIFPTKVALGQFPQRNEREPVVQFQIGSAGLKIVLVQIGVKAPLIAMDDLRGRWHRFEINARWSASADGFLTVFLNGEQVFDHRGPVMTGCTSVYFKFGIYRTFVSRYAERFGEPPPAQVAFFKDVWKGYDRR